MSDAVLEVDGLVAGYGGAPIITGICLTVKAGEISVVVGPNGAGKSTAIKAIAGVVHPSGGTVRLHGEQVAGLRSDVLTRRGLGYVPQVRNIFPSLTVRENLEMGGYGRKKGVREKIEDLLELFPDLRPAQRRAARTLSGGQRSMLATARGLMTDPRALLLDEPTAGLSPRYEAAVWQHIDAVRATGVGLLVVEQNTRRALRYANWGYVLVEGENKLDGPGRELLESEEVTELYIGGRSRGGRKRARNGTSPAARNGDEEEPAL
ncbi:MAG: ABC transporter ATP-binding protein [Acidimicrobiales bacterium]